MHGVRFIEDYRMDDRPEKCGWNYLVKEFQRSEGMRYCWAGFDAETTKDPKSNTVRTGGGQENLTGEPMDSMVRRL